MTIGPIQINLNGLIVDEDTTGPESGAVWVPTSLVGWFDTPTGKLIESDKQPFGSTITVARAQSRAVAMEIIARHPVNGAPLSDLGELTVFQAMQELKFAMSGALFVPVLVQITDPLQALESTMRLAQPIRMRIDGNLGLLTAQLPLTATDPRRYDQSAQVVSLTAGANAVTNNGDMPADVQLFAAGASNPTFQNVTAEGSPVLGVTGSGDVLINTGSEVVTIDGDPHREALTTAQWWQLLPGGNTITVSDDCTISFQDAYS